MPAISVRENMNAPGAKPPSTPTLMKRYDAPQTAPRARISGQYRELTRAR